MTPGPWYATPAGHQGLIISEATGASVAVSYDQADGPLVAAAPDLLSALRECITDSGCHAIISCDVAYMIRRFRAINTIAREAIAKAAE